MRAFFGCWLLLLCALANFSTSTSTSLRSRWSRARKEQQRLADEWIRDHRLHNDLRRQATCPCERAVLCEPISGPPLQPQGELFGFASPQQTGFDYYNWTYITSISWAPDELLCTAHEHGARLIAASPSMNLTALSLNTTAAQQWVDDVVTMVLGRFFDGITFDYEEPLEVDSMEAQTYVRLIRDTKRRLGPTYQVTVCVAWSPDGIDGRNYPVQELSQVSDALYIMDYDTQSQIFGACVAAANAPYYGMIHGMERYLSLGIPPRKLILGVPWYGYRYPCLPGTAQEGRFCPLEKVPFRGVPCSDAAGNEIPILGILRTLREHNATLYRDDNMLAPYFNTLEDQQVNQYWFDDVISLQKKYAWARAAGLAGVGPYAFHDILPSIDPQAEKEISVAMWSAFDSFFLETFHETGNSEDAFRSSI